MAAASVLAQLWAASTTGNSEEAFRVAYTSEEQSFKRRVSEGS